MKRYALGGIAALALVMALVGAGAHTTAGAPSTVEVDALQPTWDQGVFSAYVGPPSYGYVSPGDTALYLGREAGIIKAGLTADPTTCAPASYCDEGLFAFKPATTIDSLAANPLTYDVVNQYGTNPVWMTIEIDTGTLGVRTDNTIFQMVPPPYGSADYTTVNAATGTWYQWADNNGTITGGPRTLADIATTYAGLPVVRAYLRLGMGDSYGPGPDGTQAWVDKASIGGVTYDFVTQCTTTCYVDAATGNDSNSGDAPGWAKKTIQAAVNQVSDGGTVQVAAGTYVEQVDIGKQITLDGAGAGSTIIQSPLTLATMFTTGINPNKPVVNVHASGGTISHLTVDGNGVGDANYRLEGIAFHNGGGTVDHVDIVHVRDASLSGTQHGVALYAYNEDGTPRTLTVTNNSISDYQKNGMALSGTGLTVDVNHNTVTGAGVTPLIAQNGIQVGYGAAGSISDNTVSGNSCTTAPDCTLDPATDATADGAAGILLYSPGASSINVQNNTLTGNQFGVWTVAATAVTIQQNTIANTGGTGVAVWDCDQWCGPSDAVGTTGSITGNTISGAAYGLLVRDYVAGAPVPAVEAHGNSITGSASFGAWANTALNATDNWWGSDTGPANATSNPGGTGDPVADGIAFSPWLGIGTDTSAAPGFQKASPMTWIAGPAVCGATCIQAAIDDASNGDTVKAKTGVFNEHVTLNKAITLTAGSSPIIDGGGSGDVVTITANGATLNGFEIRNGANGVVLTGVSGVTVSNNTIHDQRNVPGSAGVGIMAWGDNDGNTIAGNTIHDNDRQGVFIGFCDFAGPGGDCSSATPKSTGNTISGNTIFNNGQNTLPNGPDASQYGIQLWYADTNDVGSNTLYGQTGSGFGVGIYLCNSDSNDVHGNTIHDNQYNIATYGCEEASTANNIHANTLSAAGDTNVRLFGGSPSTTVNANTMTDGKWGVNSSTGNNGVTITGNDITKFVQQGIGLYGGTGALVGGNTIDGGHVGSCIGGFWGIQVQNVSGAIDGNTVSGIGNGLTTGCQEGRAIEADGAGTVSITNNVVGTYQKSGIIVRDTVTSVITDNTTAGEGPTSAIAQNGITVTSSGAATISGNHTSGNAYTPATTVSCGILTFNTATITGNDSTQDQDGVCVAGGAGTQVKSNTVTRHRQQGILIDSATDALVDGNTIDGQGAGTTTSAGTDPDTDTRYYGVFAVDSTGTISNNTITGIKHGVGSGAQSGVGIRLSARSGASANMTISGNTLSDIQKGAIVVSNPYGGTAVNANVSGNTMTGNGPIGYIAQNGIQISNGATATVTGNDVSGYDYTGSGWAAIGIPVLSAGTTSVTNNNVHDSMEGMYVEATNNATVSGNTFSNVRDFVMVIWEGSSNGTYTGNSVVGMPTSIGAYIADNSKDNTFSGNAFRNNDYGLYVDYSWGTAPTGNVFNNNCIAGNATDGMATAGSVAVPIDAQGNWWGRIDGPSPAGSGDVIDSPATIDASAFLTAPVAGCQPPLVFTVSPGNSTGGVVFPTQPVVTIQDAGGSPVTSGPLSTSTVSLAITGPNLSGGTLSGATSIAATGGVAAFSGLSIDKPGTYTLTATDSDPSLGTAASTSFTISIGPAAQFAVAGYPSPSTAGVSHGFTVTAQDAGGNTVAGYTGTVHFTSSDAGGGTVLPANYTFVAGDSGVHAFNATLTTSGTQSITATDTVTVAITGAQSGIVVDPAVAASLLVAGFPSPAIATVPYPFTVTAKDAFGNTDTTYTGTVHFSSSEYSASLPGDYAFVPADLGTQTFTATLNLPVVHDLTATDTVSGITGTQAGIVVKLLDSDGDNCPDVRELGSVPTSGGQRDPLNPWDFYDVPVPALRINPAGTRDGGIGVTTDVVALLKYSGLTSTSPDYMADYDHNGVEDGLQYDRSVSTTPGMPWRSGPPDGGIGITTDVIAMLAQVGTSCN